MWAKSSSQYWGGCFWHIGIVKSQNNGVGAFVRSALSSTKRAANRPTPRLLLYPVQV